ncbi:BTAD domain-containing putative transcriptional regulator [Nonomuraea sp. NPDC004354]
MMRFGVLGTVEVHRDEGQLDLGSPSSRAVLARLLLSRGRVVPLDRLIEDLWEAEPPRQALASLRTFVCRLRRVLEPADKPTVLLTEPRGYRLDASADQFDADVFERLVRQADPQRDPAAALELLDPALELWRGPAYAEFAHSTWAQVEIARLEELKLAAVERRLATLLALGLHAQAIPDLEAFTRTHPMREEGWRLLALALYRSARQGDALSVLRRARGHLAEELGLDPGPALRQMEADILAQVPGLGAPPLPPVRELAAPVREPAAPVRIRCLGRDHLLDSASDVLGAAESGDGGALLVAGEPGTGRTQLLRSVEALARLRGLQVAWATACPLESGYAFGIARQLFEPMLAALPEEERARVLEGVTLPAADVIWRNRRGGDLAEVLHGLYWVTVRLARRTPLLIVLDDVQWCDPESLRWFAYTLRRLHGVPVALVVSRAAGVPSDWPDTLETTCSMMPSVRLGALPQEAATALVTEQTGAEPDPAFVSRCIAETRGNAFLLAEHVRTLDRGERPETIARWVSGLLRAAGPGAAELARAVAVLGEQATPDAVAGMAELSCARFPAVLSVLVQMGLLQDGSPLRFVHPVVQRTVLDEALIASQCAIYIGRTPF